MAYKYETQYNSPNYTPANRVAATWGVPRTVKAIAIHWWGDPNTGPTYEGVIATLCNPNRGASAHFVATGTGRRVACLVNLGDASWATNSANPYTISIECDPRCRDEDYDVVAELIAQIRSVYGDIPLVPHKQFVATACPGNYNLAELDRRARNKDGSGDWGQAKDKNMPTLIDEEGVRILAVTALERPEPLTTTPDLKSHIGGDALAKLKEFWYSKEGKAANEQRKQWRADSAKLPVVEKELEDAKAYIKKLEEQASQKPSDGSFTDNDRNTLNSIQKAVQWLSERFKSIFNIGDK